MKELSRRVVQGLAGIFQPAPSLFDILVGGMLFLYLLKEDFQKQIFFIFYSIFLLLFTFTIPKKENFKSIGLFLFTLWGLTSVFIHSYQIYKTSITFYYLNVYLLFEGFIYILFGGLFFITAVNYSKNLKYILFLLPVLLIPWYELRFTLLCAFMLSTCLYLVIKKYWIGLFILSLILPVFLFLKYKLILTRIICRPDLWKLLLLQIKEHPLIGSGFNKILSPDNMVFHSYWGWVYRHNDFLSIAAFLGIPALLFITIFVVELVKLNIHNWRIIFLVTFILTSFFQMTMFKIDKVISILLILATITKEELCSKRLAY